MEVLDTSIANVSLPHIAGSLSASHEESTWVLTSYLVSNAIILPISAWLSTHHRPQAFLHDVRRVVHLQQLPVRARAQPGNADFLPGLAGRRWRGLAAQRAGHPCGYVSRLPSAAWRSRSMGWPWCWRRQSARRWADGSPTISPGTGFSTSTCRSASFAVPDQPGGRGPAISEA